MYGGIKINYLFKNFKVFFPLSLDYYGLTKKAGNLGITGFLTNKIFLFFYELVDNSISFCFCSVWF
jgi:hypothetical protein